MPESKRPVFSEMFMTVWIIIRVALILVVWLSLFLALFLGYFTVPIILVILVSGVYALTDAAFLVSNKIRKQAENMRGEIIKNRARPDDDEPAP